MNVLRINIVLVQEGGQLFALSLRQADAERTVRIKDDLAEDEMRGLRTRDLLCWREHLLPEMLDTRFSQLECNVQCISQ